jgi:hypothetical protein
MQWKRAIQYFFQQLLGTDHYLFLTALYQWYVVRYFRPDKELDFFLQNISSGGVISKLPPFIKLQGKALAIKPTTLKELGTFKLEVYLDDGYS